MEKNVHHISIHAIMLVLNIFQNEISIASINAIMIKEEENKLKFICEKIDKFNHLIYRSKATLTEFVSGRKVACCFNNAPKTDK